MRNDKCYRIILLLVIPMAFVALLNQAAAAPLETIIYQDSFTVDGVGRQYGGNLNATTIEGAMLDWIAPGGLVFADIDGEDVVYANARSNSALINADMTLVGGTVKVEADVMPLGNASDDAARNNWVAIGFQPGQASTAHSGAGLWMLLRGNGGYQVFLNATTTLLANGSIAGYVQGQVANISITYDSGSHIANFAVDDQVILTHDLTGTDFPEAEKRPFIITYDGGQYFDNYTVSMEGGVLPIITSLQSPQDGAIQVDVVPELSWSVLFPVEEDLVFDVYMDPNGMRVTTLDPSTLVSQQRADFSYSPEYNLEYETTYYWLVRPYINGEPNQPTEARSFTTDYEIAHWSDASWTNDADSGISAGKTYTHAVNLRGGAFGTIVVNGVPFDGPSGRSGANWVLDGAPNETGGGAINIEGSTASLVGGFYYNTPASLTLTDLTPGQEYVLTLYTKGWGSAGGREVRLTTSDDGRVVEFDENVDGDGYGHTFSHTYTAPESGELTVDFVPVGAGTWHHYAFSNEVNLAVYLDPSPIPGLQIQSELDLSWQLHGEVVNPSYNLYVSADANNLDLIIANQDQTTYHINLDPEKTYFWKVEVVEDGGSVVYESPVWDFTTSPPPDAEKVLEWKMDETAGSIVNQTGTSEGADGILSGFNDPNASTMFVTGLVGNALLLNGTTEYLDVSAATPYMPTGNEQAFAVSAYFRTYKAYGPIFSMRNSTNGTPLIDITIGHDGAYESAGRIKMLVRDDNNNLGPNTNSGILVNDGRWHSLVVMRAKGNWTMYVDGIVRARATGVASGAVTLDWLAIGAEKMWVFADYGSWNGSRTDIRYFKGMLDEVCVWSGEMREHQIAEHAALVPPQGDINFDMATDMDDLAILAETWLSNSRIPVQDSIVLEDMESYIPSDPNTFIPYWEGLQGGVSLENVFGNVATAPTSATVGTSVNSIVDDDLYGQVLQWDYDLPANKTNAIQRFWLLDRRLNLGLYDQISIRVKKLAGSTGDRFYFDFHDGRGMTDPTDGIYPWVLAWQARIIMGLADLPDDQWVTLTADIPSGFSSGRPLELNDLYEVTIGINSAGVARAGTILIDEISLTDATETCMPQVGVLFPDMTGDCMVNLEDFALLAENWLMGM